MTRRFTLRAEILGGLDDPCPEVLLPILVHRNARGERVRRVEDPFCESQTVGRQVARHWRQERGDTRYDLLALIVVLPAAQYKCVARLRYLRHDHGRGDRLFKLVALFSEFCQSRIKLPVLLGRVVPQKVFAQAGLMLLSVSLAASVSHGLPST